jgi:hypothetical protein
VEVVGFAVEFAQFGTEIGTEVGDDLRTAVEDL